MKLLSAIRLYPHVGVVDTCHGETFGAGESGGGERGDGDGGG